MKTYRIRHIPTGLYFMPSREIKIKLQDGKETYVKSNVGKKGKVYTNKPTLKYLGDGYYNHVYMEEHYKTKGYSLYSQRDKLFPVISSEWIIEEVE